MKNLEYSFKRIWLNIKYFVVDCIFRIWLFVVCICLCIKMLYWYYIWHLKVKECITKAADLMNNWMKLFFGFNMNGEELEELKVNVIMEIGYVLADKKD